MKKFKASVINAKNVVTTALMSMTTAVMVAAPAYAAGSDALFTGVKKAMTNLYEQLNGIFTLCCVVIIVIAAFMYIFSKSPRKIEAASDWIKRVFGMWLVVNILGWILEFGKSITSGGQYNA